MQNGKKFIFWWIESLLRGNPTSLILSLTS
jgi:hypothetical protein